MDVFVPRLKEGDARRVHELNTIVHLDGLESMREIGEKTREHRSSRRLEISECAP